MFKSDWNIQIINGAYDQWETLISHLQVKINVVKKKESVPSPSTQKLTSSLTGSRSNYTLSSVKKACIIKLIESIKEEDKWKLESGRFVKVDVVDKKKSCYEHSFHSLIMDPRNKIWEDFFTKAELKEIQSIDRTITTIGRDARIYQYHL